MMSRSLSLIIICWVLCAGSSMAMGDTSMPRYVQVQAGEQYARSAVYKLFWGKNRRAEWTTPVTVPVLLLDTLMGGTKPYQKGGGNESKSLRLRTVSGKELALRSIDKSRKDVIPKYLRNTYFGHVIQDGVSMSHPYGALALHGMMTSAHIPHSVPRLVYVPHQPALDSFDAQFGDDLYLLEDRPDGDQRDNEQMGNFTQFRSTTGLLKKMAENNTVMADQFAYIKARLFDILINDWDRNHDNWRWGIQQESDNVYQPVPRDRDQAFFTRNSIMMKLLMPLSKTSYMQNFKHDIKKVEVLTSQDRIMDQLFANAMSEADWVKAANILKQELNDEVITASVKQLPAEIFAISGQELIDKLRARRDQLQQYAMRMYRTLAKEVEVNGSAMAEHFMATNNADGSLTIAVYRMQENKKEERPYYQRTFFPQHTRTITLNGFDGKDVFNVADANGILIKVNKGKSSNKLYSL